MKKKKKPKHTAHSRVRAHQRAGGNIRRIEHNIRVRKFIGLPRQTLNKRVALMKIDNEWVVVVWTKESKRIVTVMSLDQYKSRYGLSQSVTKQMEVIDGTRSEGEKGTKQPDDKGV